MTCPILLYRHHILLYIIYENGPAITTERSMVIAVLHRLLLTSTLILRLLLPVIGPHSTMTTWVHEHIWHFNNAVQVCGINRVLFTTDIPYNNAGYKE